MELHVFTDASELSFAASAYLRYPIEDGYNSSLLASKSRVAPLKMLSIPRLELQGALIGSRLVGTLETELNLPIKRKVYWTDSEIVLKYINNPARRFKPFVANRVAKILVNTDVSEWRHVPTDQNPADISSRGLKLRELI
ncbi:uncharacterized protein LOC135494045 [Lineus longissimus]|uniref:uncharacterized protein LOC135494045 n=1 Tax=Lineus longissimus TaxID=88925 RepID=UPI00315D86F0